MDKEFQLYFSTAPPLYMHSLNPSHIPQNIPEFSLKYIKSVPKYLVYVISARKVMLNKCVYSRKSPFFYILGTKLRISFCRSWSRLGILSPQLMTEDPFVVLCRQFVGDALIIQFSHPKVPTAMK